MQSLIHIRLTGIPSRANRCFPPRVFGVRIGRRYEAQEPNSVGSWSKFIMKSTEWDLQSVCQSRWYRLKEKDFDYEGSNFT